jgi:hypothetical protein
MFKNERNHEPVRTVLSTLIGIKASEFRTTTGSLTIFYDPDLTQGDDIVRALEGAGHFDSTQAMTNDEYVHHMVSRAGSLVGRAFFGSAMDVALESTGLALLGLLM